MKTNNKSQPAETQDEAASKGVPAELSQEIVIAIADYLDVFIEIDLEVKQLKQGEEYGTNQNGTASSRCLGKAKRPSKE
ncbi:MAG: hypothetical protein AAB395_03725 [Patescibacteria group bacterium]